MLGTTDIEVHIAPVLICLAAYKGLVIVRIHVAEIVGAAACKSRHRALFYRTTIIGPVFCASKRRFSRLSRKILIHFREFQRQFVHRHRSSDSVLEIHRERLSPVSLT